MIEDFQLLLLYKYILNLCDVAENNYKEKLYRVFRSSRDKSSDAEITDLLVAKIHLDTVLQICYDISNLFHL